LDHAVLKDDGEGRNLDLRHGFTPVEEGRANPLPEIEARRGMKEE
jgi:hypothetical protein